MVTDVKALIGQLPLKEMDGTLLVSTIRAEAALRGWPMTSINAAVDLAAWAHRAQTRANRSALPRTPYIEHPLRNAARLLRWGCNDGAVILAAILHDVVEDCSAEISAHLLGQAGLSETAARAATLRYIMDNFGETVAAVVYGLSNPIAERDLPRERKNFLYVKHVRAAIADPCVCLVKVADITDNASGLHHNLAGDSSRGMVQRLAVKYSPVFLPLLARIEQPDVAELLSEEGWRQMQASLLRGQGRIEKLLAVSAAA